MRITTVGIDLAKNVFQVHGVNEHGNAVMKKQLKRHLVIEFFANDWLRVSRTSEIVCKPRRCWILVRRSESARIRTFGWPKCREPSNGNGYRRV